MWRERATGKTRAWLRTRKRATGKTRAWRLARKPVRWVESEKQTRRNKR